MPGAYNAEKNLVYWGTANPAPLFDWAGDNWQTDGARPGDNLYTSSMIALDPDTGQLKSYFQTLPHDTWDFDDAVGEFVQIEKDGQKYIVHPNKGGYVYVFDDNLGFKNAWPLGREHQLHPGRGQERQADRPAQPDGGQDTNLCPAIAGGISWNSGTYNPKTGLYYKVGAGVVHGPRGGEDHPGHRAHEPAQHRRELRPDGPAGRQGLRARRRARSAHRQGGVAGRLSRSRRWPRCSRPAATCCSCPTAAASSTPTTSRNGTELWSHNDGIGHNGGIISYSAKGKQYVTVAVGWGSLVGDNFPKMFGGAYTSMPTDQGYLVTYTLP